MDQKLNEKIDLFLDAHRDDMVRTLCDLVRIPSVQAPAQGVFPYGPQVARALDYALETCAALGYRTENYGYRCGSAVFGDQPGELGFVAHLDVVPAGEGWSGKPFEPFLRDGYVVGRGARDNKNGAVAGLFALRCIQELGIPLRHSLRLIFGCAEETGMDDLPYYLEKHPAPAFSIVPDTEFPVCHGEKGIYTADLLFPVGEELLQFSSGVAANVVPDHASALVCAAGDPAEFDSKGEGRVSAVREGEAFRLTASGVCAHAAHPEGSVSALREMADFLSREPACRLLSEGTRRSMRLLSEILSDHEGIGLGIAAEDAPSAKLTCISGLARLEERGLRVSLNIRYPVTHDGGKITAGLRAYADAHALLFDFDDDDKPSFTPADHPAIERLTRVYADVTGESLPPYVMGGGTYARHLPNAVAFGPDFPGEELPCPAGHGSCHEPDECQSIDGLMKAVKIYVQALIELDAVID